MNMKLFSFLFLGIYVFKAIYYVNGTAWSTKIFRSLVAQGDETLNDALERISEAYIAQSKAISTTNPASIKAAILLPKDKNAWQQPKTKQQMITPQQQMITKQQQMITKQQVRVEKERKAATQSANTRQEHENDLNKFLYDIQKTEDNGQSKTKNFIQIVDQVKKLEDKSRLKSKDHAKKLSPTNLIVTMLKEEKLVNERKKNFGKLVKFLQNTVLYSAKTSYGKELIRIMQSGTQRLNILVSTNKLNAPEPDLISFEEAKVPVEEEIIEEFKELASQKGKIENEQSFEEDDSIVVEVDETTNKEEMTVIDVISSNDKPKDETTNKEEMTVIDLISSNDKPKDETQHDSSNEDKMEDSHPKGNRNIVDVIAASIQKNNYSTDYMKKDTN